ncbi:AraC family transcriptional regulator [Altibacter sp. HG106]|uniref:AraC family transcriptional regulator n=1 Tax=Altibacter sp. HG106 TaxID=3023937 RepID=UPI00234FF267|nr:AraC family transcriptional regulator [Altibacter sp. HG106]MDC7995073.1 AraC family transcriptional regulator [Altibacter sp. HG106]
MNVDKSIAERLSTEWLTPEGLLVLKCTNDGAESQLFKRTVASNMIQFHFCIKGNAQFIFNDGNYSLPLSEDRSLLLYNPQRELPLNLVLPAASWVVSVIVPIQKFHEFFSSEANYISFLSEENRERKYYKEAPITPSMAIVLNQLVNTRLHASVQSLYLKAKIYELMSLYFHRPAHIDIEQCPFLADEENLVKLKRAKEIIIRRMAEPPTLQELSDEIDLSLNKLKEGFKQVYGDSVFSFLFDYKMEVARNMLATGNYAVGDVGLKVGYSTASHFIAAFKKKFGTTPKKFVMSLTS